MKSYLKFLSRNKLYTAIEAIGLVVSLAFVVIISCFAVQELDIVHEFDDRERIYTVNMPVYPGVTFGFNDHLARVAPEVEVASRWCPEISAIVSCAGESFSVKGAATDPQFFEIFHKYRFVEGSPEVLRGRSNIVVSQSFAARLPFDNPVGKTLEARGESYVIAGIVEDFSCTVFPYCDFLVGIEASLNEDSWSALYDHYGSTVPVIRLSAGASRDEFAAKMDALCKELYPRFYGCRMFEYCRVLRVDEIYFAALPCFNGGDKRKLLLFVGIGLLLLLSAIFNYINLSFALTGLRAREMATRRLVGATKGRIFGKYVAEALFFVTVCMVLALLLAVAIVPVLNGLLGTDISVSFTPCYLAVFVGIVAFVGVVGGVVPAVVASGYEPIDVVRGKQRRDNKRVFSKIFIVFQGTLAVFMISMALTTEAQYRKSLSRPLHARIDNYYFLRWGANFDVDKYKVLSDRLLQLPFVERVGCATAVPGTRTGGQYCTSLAGEELLFRLYRVDSTAFSMLGFDKLHDFGTPVRNGVWFGEKGFNAMGFTPENHDISPLSQRTGGADYVAGVIADFPVTNTNMGAEDNVVVAVNRAEDLYFAGLLIETVDYSAENGREIREVFDVWCKETYGTLIEPMEADYIRDIFRAGLSESYRQMRLIEVFMVVAVLISLLGLLAMSVWYAARQSSDIAVRKVFGSTVAREVSGSVAFYMLLVGISCVIGVPFAVYAAGRYLQEYIYRIENYWWIFALAVVLSLTVAFLSVLWQTLRSAQTNPAIRLKKE